MSDEIELLVDRLAEMDSRLRQLEGGQRAGMSSTAQDRSTVPFNVPTWDSSIVWYDNAGVTTPSVTLQTGRRVEIRAACEVDAIGTGVGDFKSQQFFVGIKIDGVDPVIGQPLAMSFTRSTEGWDIMPVTFLTGVWDLEPGEHTFDLVWAAFENDAMATQVPRVLSSYLSVTPFGWG